MEVALTEKDRATFLPRFGETETVYSMAARLHWLRGATAAVDTSIWLFGYRWAASINDVPGGLSQFEGITRGRLGAPESLLMTHTVAGLYLKFLDPERRSRVISACSGTPGGRSKFLLGMPSSRLPALHSLRLCPACASEDRVEYGCGLWRVEHQLPGALICPRHEQVLLEPMMNGTNRKEWLRPDDLVPLGPSRTIDRKNMPFWSNVSAALIGLFKMRSLDKRLLSSLIRNELVKDGVLGTVNATNEFRLQDWAAKSGLTMAVDDAPEYAALRSKSWMRDLILGRRSAHPLRWAVLCAMALRRDQLADLDHAVQGFQMSLDGSWQPAGASNRLKSRSNKAVDQPDLALSAVSSASKIAPLPTEPCEQGKPIKSIDLGAERLARYERATMNVETFLRMRPDANRTELLRFCMNDVRWLERNAPAWIQARRPGRTKGSGKQLALI